MQRPFVVFAVSVVAWWFAGCSAGTSAGTVETDFLTADVHGIAVADGLGGELPPLAGGPGRTTTNTAGDVQREIAEADVYAVAGDRLYVLNVWRGLTIVDLQQSVVLGRLSLHAVPHELYLRGDRAFVLVDGQAADRTAATTRLVEVAVADAAAPAVVRDVAMAGAFRTSRLVGDVAYVVTEQGAWSYALDAAPFASVGTIAFAGAQAFAHATDRFLFVASSEFGSDTVVRAIDISAPGGAMVARGSIALGGFLSDDQKLHYGGGCLRVVTHDWSQALSHLFTIDMQVPDAPTVMARLDLARGEQLFGTCFDELRAYVVTFERVDPLWIIDLADPTRPRIAGELQVPGFSTQLVCSGNQLIGLGYADGWSEPSVSLFDVSVPSQPRLLSRAAVGADVSTALHERRALTVTADTVAVPTWNGLAVFDRGPTTLTLRGRIAVRGGSMRATRHPRGLLAIGPEQIAVADPTTLAVTAAITIAENVGDVGRLGDGSQVEVVFGVDSSAVRGVEVPLAVDRMFVHDMVVALRGYDQQGAAIATIDFASTPPRVSPLLRLESGGVVRPAGNIAVIGYGGLEVLTADGMLLLQGMPAADARIIGRGELRDGFVAVDLAANAVRPGIAIHGAVATGIVADGGEVAISVASYAGLDTGARPLVRSELHRVDLRGGKVTAAVPVPGVVLAVAGSLVHTREDRWLAADWTVRSFVAALRVVGGAATRLDRLELPDFAWDHRVADGLLVYTAFAGGPSPLVATPWTFAGNAIATVRLGARLVAGPRIDGDAYRNVVAMGAGRLLCGRDGLAAEVWDLRGDRAVQVASSPIDGYIARGVADPAEPGAFLLALGHAGSVTVR